MNGKQAKNIRRAVRNQVRVNYEGIYNELKSLKFFDKLYFCFGLFVGKNKKPGHH